MTHSVTLTVLKISSSNFFRNSVHVNFSLQKIIIYKSMKLFNLFYLFINLFILHVDPRGLRTRFS